MDDTSHVSEQTERGKRRRPVPVDTNAVDELCGVLIAMLGGKMKIVHRLNQRIDFVQGKTQHRISLPLLKDVGWALIDYIQNGRPKIDTPYIFVTHVAPFKEFDQGNRHSRMVRKYMNLAHLTSVNTHKCGMHSLRHTLASTMVENREKFSNISATLGHRSEDSTAIYLKTGVELLRDCALEIPEV